VKKFIGSARGPDVIPYCGNQDKYFMSSLISHLFYYCNYLYFSIQKEKQKATNTFQNLWIAHLTDIYAKWRGHEYRIYQIRRTRISYYLRLCLSIYTTPKIHDAFIRKFDTFQLSSSFWLWFV